MCILFQYIKLRWFGWGDTFYVSHRTLILSFVLSTQNRNFKQTVLPLLLSTLKSVSTFQKFGIQNSFSDPGDAEGGSGIYACLFTQQSKGATKIWQQVYLMVHAHEISLSIYYISLQFHKWDICSAMYLAMCFIRALSL